MGIELASHILAGLLIGWLLDKWLGTEPVWLIVGTITGVVVGMTDFIRAALKAQKRITEQRPAPKKVQKRSQASESPGVSDAKTAGNDDDSITPISH